jgi:hypothetical protein
MSAVSTSPHEPSALLGALAGDSLRALGALLDDGDLLCFRLVCSAFREHSEPPTLTTRRAFLGSRARAAFAWDALPGFALARRSRRFQNKRPWRPHPSALTCTSTWWAMASTVRAAGSG